jgi:hypothetical protein
MAAKKAKKAKRAKKSAKPKDTVTLTMKIEVLQKIVDAVADLGAPGFCFEKFCDDETVARDLKKRLKKGTA